MSTLATKPAHIQISEHDCLREQEGVYALATIRIRVITRATDDMTVHDLKRAYMRTARHALAIQDPHSIVLAVDCPPEELRLIQT